MSARALPADLQGSLNALKAMLDAAVRKARDEGYTVEIHVDASTDEHLYVPSLTRRYYATPAERPKPTRIK